MTSLLLLLVQWKNKNKPAIVTKLLLCTHASVFSVLYYDSTPSWYACYTHFDLCRQGSVLLFEIMRGSMCNLFFTPRPFATRDQPSHTGSVLETPLKWQTRRLSLRVVVVVVIGRRRRRRIWKVTLKVATIAADRCSTNYLTIRPCVWIKKNKGNRY